jgi:hypothetical protein
MENIDSHILQQVVLSFTDAASLYNWAWNCGLQHHPTIQHRINQINYYFSQQNLSFGSNHFGGQQAYSNGYDGANGLGFNCLAAPSASNSRHPHNVSPYVSILIIILSKRNKLCCRITVAYRIIIMSLDYINEGTLTISIRFEYILHMWV